MSGPLYFAELTSQAVHELHGEARPTVLLLPVGATEPHGPHLPLSTDSIISAGVCERAAGRLAGSYGVRALILPSLPYGVTRFGAALAGAVSVAEATLHALVTDICRSLAAQGFGRVVIVNNHFEPEHVAVLRRAVQELRKDGAPVALLDVLRRRNVQRLTAEFQAGESHGGSYETSMILAERSDLVDTEWMRALPHVPVNMAAAIAEGHTDFVAMGMPDGYCGAPAKSTAQEGVATLETLTDMLVELIRDVATWEG
ncbi:MAG TPA: creatininase family protein [Jiangellaceae bacterium]